VFINHQQNTKSRKSRYPLSYIVHSPKFNVPWAVHHDINFEAITNLMHKYLYSYNITIIYMFRAPWRWA